MTVTWLWRADATLYIAASSRDEAEEQLEEWIAEHMPSNFVASWSLPEEAEEER